MHPTCRSMRLCTQRLCPVPAELVRKRCTRLVRTTPVCPKKAAVDAGAVAQSCSRLWLLSTPPSPVEDEDPMQQKRRIRSVAVVP